MSVSANSSRPLMEGRLGENGFEYGEILPAIDDSHGGVIVEMKKGWVAVVHGEVVVVHGGERGRVGGVG